MNEGKVRIKIRRSSTFKGSKIMGNIEVKQKIKNREMVYVAGHLHGRLALTSGLLRSTDLGLHEV